MQSCRRAHTYDRHDTLYITVSTELRGKTKNSRQRCATLIYVLRIAQKALVQGYGKVTSRRQPVSKILNKHSRCVAIQVEPGGFSILKFGTGLSLIRPFEVFILIKLKPPKLD